MNLFAYYIIWELTKSRIYVVELYKTIGAALTLGLADVVMVERNG